MKNHYAPPKQFNYDKTSVASLPLSESDQSRKQLAEALNRGWGLPLSSDISRIASGTKVYVHSFKVESGGRKFHLKINDENSPEFQTLVNDVILHCRERGALAPFLVPTLSGKSFIAEPEGNYCLYDYLEGEHFGGSVYELESAAWAIANLDKALSAFPSERLVRAKGLNVMHDQSILPAIEARLRKSRPESDEEGKFDEMVRRFLPDMKKLSKSISLADLSKLPFQIIHNDLHPHNVLFDPKQEAAKVINDFDSISVSQRIRDVGYAMHRFARTYHGDFETPHYIDADAIPPHLWIEAENGVICRAEAFLKEYRRTNRLTKKELELLPIVLLDEELSRLLRLLRHQYLESSKRGIMNIEKRIEIMRETSTFNFKDFAGRMKRVASMVREMNRTIRLLDRQEREERELKEWLARNEGRFGA